MAAVLRVHRIHPRAAIPVYKTPGAAGMDLSACLDEALQVSPGKRVRVPTGISIALPQGHEGQVRPRSGLASKHGITVVNAPGTIDEDYRGEVQVLLINLGQETFTITHGDRIAQLVVAPVMQVEIEEVADADALGATQRGESGFGSTG